MLFLNLYRQKHSLFNEIYCTPTIYNLARKEIEIKANQDVGRFVLTLNLSVMYIFKSWLHGHEVQNIAL